MPQYSSLSVTAQCSQSRSYCWNLWVQMQCCSSGHSTFSLQRWNPILIRCQIMQRGFIFCFTTQNWSVRGGQFQNHSFQRDVINTRCQLIKPTIVMETHLGFSYLLYVVQYVCSSDWCYYIVAQAWFFFIKVKASLNPGMLLSVKCFHFILKVRYIKFLM